jgi:hypothetical protein
VVDVNDEDQAPRHPADSRGLRVTGQPPHVGQVTRVRDVLICPVDANYQPPEGELEAHPWATDAGDLDLGFGLSLTRLPSDEAELVIDACSPRGHFFYAKRQFGQRYSYVFSPTEEQWHANRSGWDPEQRIVAAMHLARLVRDNGDSIEYAARIYDYDDGQQQVIPRNDFELALAYRSQGGREWLDPQEAEELRVLLDRYWSHEPLFPDRVKRALRRTSALVRERYLDDRLPQITVALESLMMRYAELVGGNHCGGRTSDVLVWSHEIHPGNEHRSFVRTRSVGDSLHGSRVRGRCVRRLHRQRRGLALLA